MNYKLVYICSPLRPILTNEPERTEELNTNIKLARDACTLAVYRGFLPVAPHLYFPQFLNDDDPDERALAMRMNIVLLSRCDELWVFGKPSAGMAGEIAYAMKYGIPIRWLDSEGRSSAYE